MSSGFLETLRLDPVINGNSWVTSLGGSIMAPEVLEAMQDAAGCFVDMVELHEKAGRFIAEVTGAESGMVTSGGSASLVLQAAASMTGPDEKAASRLPVSDGLRNEIVLQRAHRNRYDGAWCLAGAVLKEIGTARATAEWELEAAIDDDTAAVGYVFAPFLRHPLGLRRVVEIAHAHGVPVIVDAAAEVPPASNLRRFIDEGADLVAMSGGKGLCGPQSSGLLFGRRDLIKAAAIHSLNFDSPHAGIGRPMKASKESIVGLLKAIELFLACDHKALWRRWHGFSSHIVDQLADLKGVNAVVESRDRTGPQAVLYFDGSWNNPIVSVITKSLWEGSPRILVGHGGFRGELFVVPVCLREGEAEIIAARLREEICRHAANARTGSNR